MPRGARARPGCARSSGVGPSRGGRAPSRSREEMSGREVHVRLVVGIAPGLVGGGGQRPLLRRGQQLRPALDRPGQADARDGVGHVVLGATLLRTGGGRRIGLEGGKRREHLLPVLAVRGPRARAQGVELRGGHEHARMHADELRLEADGMRQELGERRDGFGARGEQQHGREKRGQDHPLISNRWMGPARRRTATSPNGPSSAAAAKTGVYPMRSTTRPVFQL